MKKTKIILIIAALILLCGTVLAYLLTRDGKVSDKEYYIYDGALFKPFGALNEDQVLLAAAKIEETAAGHPESGKIYFSIIPDKNYYSPEQDKHPSINYDRLVELMQENAVSAEYIDIFKSLDIGSYYHTDIHWRQEALFTVAQTLCGAMDVPCAPLSDYTQASAGDFFGSIAKQSGISVEMDDLRYLTSEATENAIVKSAEQEGAMPVYTLDKFGGNDPYAVFLSGAAAVITIENENAKTQRELIVFRDSFGSALAPLLIDSYSKITLLDLRYLSSSIIDEYANFEGADILFIYSTLMLNSGGNLR